jgi:lipid-binding SYLF domain-containing protein
MKKTAIVTTMLLSLASTAFASERRDADIDRVQTASTVLSQIMEAPDRAIPDSIMSGAKCIAIIPSSLKASFVFGANYGKGVATCRTGKGWSTPAFFKLTGGSFGFQAGGQASDLVLIVRTDDGMQHLLQSKFKLGADASAAAGPVGRDAQAMTDLTLRAQVLTYSRSRGLFLGVSLSGGVIKQDEADTEAFYGKDWTYSSLLKGEVPAPKDAEVLLHTVEKYAPTPRAMLAPSASATPASAPVGQMPGNSPASSAPLTASSAPSTAATTTTPDMSSSAGAQPEATASPESMPAESPAATPAQTTSPAATPAAAASSAGVTNR